MPMKQCDIIVLLKCWLSRLKQRTVTTIHVGDLLLLHVQALYRENNSSAFLCHFAIYMYLCLVQKLYPFHLIFAVQVPNMQQKEYVSDSVRCRLKTQKKMIISALKLNTKKTCETMSRFLI